MIGIASCVCIVAIGLLLRDYSYNIYLTKTIKGRILEMDSFTNTVKVRAQHNYEIYNIRLSKEVFDYYRMGDLFDEN